jgi:hypothetical protein
VEVMKKVPKWKKKKKKPSLGKTLELLTSSKNVGGVE